MSEIQVIPVTLLNEEAAMAAADELGVMMENNEALRRQLDERVLGRLAMDFMGRDAARQTINTAQWNSDYDHPRGGIIYDGWGQTVGYVEADPNRTNLSMAALARSVGGLANRQSMLVDAQGYEGSRITAWVDPTRPEWHDELAQAYEKIRQDPKQPWRPLRDAWTIEARDRRERRNQMNDYHRAIILAGYQHIEDGSYDFGPTQRRNAAKGKLFIAR